MQAVIWDVSATYAKIGVARMKYRFVRKKQDTNMSNIMARTVKIKSKS